MKRLKVKDAGQCMACLQCAVACASAFYKEGDVTKACIRIVEGKTPKSVAVRSCIQCGKCARSCEAGAISQNPRTGVYVIDKKLCVRCGKCAEVCPFGLIVKTAPDAVPSKCVSCGICAKQCPMEILEVVES